MFIIVEKKNLIMDREPGSNIGFYFVDILVRKISY